MYITQAPAINTSLDGIIMPKLEESAFCSQVKSMNSILMASILEEIQTSALVIPEHQKPFKLKTVTDDNDRLNQSTIGGISKVSLYNNRMFKSELTEDEKQKIRQLLKKQKKFMKELKDKENKHHEEIEKDRLSNLKLAQQIKQEKCQQRKKLMQKQREDGEKRQQQRMKMIEQGKQELSSLKKSKKLYQQYQRSWEITRNMEAQKLKSLTSKKRQQHRFDLEDIRKHERQYQHLSKQKEDIRSRQHQQFQSTVKSNLPKIQKSKFYQTLREQERQKEQEQKNKENMREQLKMKKTQYARMVKQNYKPRISESHMMNMTSVTQERQLKKPQLLLEEVRNLGNDYMRQVNKESEIKRAKRQQNESQLPSQESTTKENKQPGLATYKNYLVEMKQKRKSIEVKDRLTNEVSKIMQNQGLSTSEKVERAKLVARRLEMTDGSHKSKAMISSINQKMKMLDMLMSE